MKNFHFMGGASLCAVTIQRKEEYIEKNPKKVPSEFDSKQKFGP